MTSTASILEQIRALVEPLTAEERLMLIQIVAAMEPPPESYVTALIERRQQLVHEQAAWYVLSPGERQQSQESHMINDTLTQAQHLIDRLTPPDQVRLLAYLTSHLARFIEAMPPIPPPSETDSAVAWQEFFRLGDALAATDASEAPTLTATILSLRR